MNKVATTNCFESINSEINTKIHRRAAEIAESLGLELDCRDLADDSAASQIRAMTGYDAAIIGSEPFTREIAAALSDKLKAVVRFGVGFDAVDLAAAAELGIPVANTPKANSLSVAEHALAMMLALLKKIVINCNALKAGTWDELVGSDLSKKTVGFVGFGSVPQQLAVLLSGFSCRMVAFDPFFNKDAAAARGVKQVDIDSLLDQSDVVSIHAPLMSDTAHLVDEGFIAKMKSSAILVNTSRGGIIDEGSLYSALKDRRIAGAGLDVFESEPTDGENPILTLDNVVVSPHVAASTFETAIRTYETALKTIKAIFANEPCENILNG